MQKIILLFILSTTVTFALNVKGEFKGWTGKTIVKLDDGSEWEQEEYYYHYCYKYSPKVKLIKEGGKIKMLVDDCGNQPVAVKLIRGYSNSYENNYTENIETLSKTKSSNEQDLQETTAVWSQNQAQLDKLKSNLPEGTDHTRAEIGMIAADGVDVRYTPRMEMPAREPVKKKTEEKAQNSPIDKELLAHSIENVKQYNKQIEADPNNFNAYLERAKSKINLKDFRGALLDFDKAIDLETSNKKLCSVYFYRGIAYSYLSKYEDALLDMNNSIFYGDLEKDNLMNQYYWKGHINYLLSKNEEACLDWSKAGELGYSEAYEMIQKYCN